MFEIDFEHELEPIVFLRYRHSDGCVTTLMIMEPERILEFPSNSAFDLSNPVDGFLTIKWQDDSIDLEVAMIRKRDQKVIALKSLEAPKTPDNMRTLKECLSKWHDHFATLT